MLVIPCGTAHLATVVPKIFIIEFRLEFEAFEFRIYRCFYSHRFDPGTPFDYAVRSGKSLYAGISNYDVELTKEATEILKRLGTPCLIQVKY
jgi:intein-encoded DNA endonuclease-like protein